MSHRDKSIERLLRHAGESNGELDRPCLDAETLAAFVDDALPAPARREAEMHLADCDRCQALTASIVRTQPTANTATGEVSGARRALNWLVPATAAAAAVGLWVLVPDQSAERAAAPAISDQQTSAVPPTAAAVEPERLESLAATTTRQGEPAPAPPTAILRDRLASAPAELERSAAAAAEVRREAKLEESVRVGAVASSEAAGRSNQAGAPEASPASPPSRDTGARESDTVVQQRAAAFAPVVLEVASPNPRIRWRVASGGTVQRTDDQGITWTSQQVGAGAELIAGSSPAPDVCWLVSRGGIVLRTVDAGRSWQRAALPEAAAALAITASTGVDAVVSLADGRRLATADGGRTWVQAP